MISIYHANPKGTGSALKIELHAAQGDNVDGALLFRIAPQKAETERDTAPLAWFDWKNAVSFKLDMFDAARFVEVFRGMAENINDGKGIYHCSTKAATVIKFEHVVEPRTGYFLNVIKRDRETDKETNACLFFNTTEATAVALAIEGAFVRMAFGSL